jgi:hypothetical protein
MKKKFILSILSILLFTMYGSSIIATTNFSCPETFEESSQTILTNLDNLKIHEGSLLLEVDGGFLPIQTLQRSGDSWILTFNGYCPRMHPLCECNQCHNPSCAYYVKYCPYRR